MKIAFSTLACQNASVEEIIAASKAYSMDGIEIRLEPGNQFANATCKEDVKRIAGQLRKAGIVVVDLGSSICLQGCEGGIPDSAGQTIEYAALMGAKGIRVFLGHFAARVNPMLPSPDYEGITAQLKILCDMAAQKGIQIWVETHNEFATGKVLRQLLKDVDRENMMIIWDILHPIEDGEGIEETWRLIGDRIAHVHIKDGYDRKDPGWHDYCYTLLGEGSLPIGSVLDLLKTVGYEGYISLEWERAWRPELEKYPDSLDWVLSHYRDYLKKYEENPVPAMGECWECKDGPGRNDLSVFSFSEMGTEACIDNRKPYPSCKWMDISVKLTPDRKYKVSVPYQEEETCSVQTVYAMLTLMNEKSERTRRFYMNKKHPGLLEYTFYCEQETSMLIQLGIKRTGQVIWYRPMVQQLAQKWLQRKIRIASVAQDVIELTYEENLRRMEEAFDRNATCGVDLIAFAETMNTRGVTDLAYENSFETIDGRFCTMMKKKAKEHDCYVFFSFRELDEHGCRRNTAVLLDRQGELVGKFHKIHLTIGEYENGMVPGDEYPVFDTELGRVGMLVCWDMYYTEPARMMAQKGAEILLVSTAGNPTFRHIGRAKENGVYVVVSCASLEKEAAVAPTKIIDPCGIVLADCDREGEAAVAQIDLEEEKHIYWLSVGPCDAVPYNIYQHEYRDDL